MAEPKITYGDSGLGVEEAPPFLFPRFSSFRFDEWGRREYVEAELLSMIAQGNLSATDLLRQRTQVRDYVGMLLKGVKIDDESRRMVAIGEQINPQILNHQIHVRCIEGRADTVKFVRQKKPVPRGIASKSGQSEAGVSGDLSSWRRVIKPMVAEHVDYQAKEVALPLTEAWVCLSQHGKNCRRAPNADLRKRYWLYEEYKPEEKRGPGRPKKDSA